MSKIVYLEEIRQKRKREESIENFNWTDPCSKCDKFNKCNYTCATASDWWLTLIEIMKRNKNVS